MVDARLHIGVDGRELLGQPTGVGRYLTHVLREWAADRSWPHQVTIFVPSAPPADLATLGSSFSFVTLEATSSGTWWEQTRLPAAVRQSGANVFFGAGYTLPLRSRVPSVVAIYDVSFWAHPEWFGPREGLRRRFLTRAAARRAAAVVTISNFSADEIVRFLGVSKDKIVLAPPGAPTRRSHQAGSAAPTVLFVGSLFARRHVPELVHAVAIASARIPAIRLVLVGDDRAQPPVDPMNLARQHGIADRVEWHAYVPDSELDALYARARVFAFLSEYEGFGMTPLEAAASGVPPVVLDTAVAREVLGDGARFVTLDPQAIAAALVELLADNAAHARLSEAASRRLDAYSWTESAATIRRALERAAVRPSS